VPGLCPPELWQGEPFGHREAFLDFLGTHDHWHSALAIPTGVAQRRFDDLVENLDRHNDTHLFLASALSLSPPQDLSRYDLRRRDGWVLFMQAHALEHARLRAATGL